MNGREFWELSQLSSGELEASLGALLGAGAWVEARIVAHLAEVEARRLHLLAGCSSLYDYCRKRLGLSDYEAFVRIAAARVARKYPLVFGMLERRELHLTAICEVREYLSAENHRELLQVVSGKTKLQIREVLAERFPQADVPTNLKKLPALEPLSPGRYRLLLTLSTEQKEKLELARDLLSHANRTGDLAVVVERALDELIARLEKRRLGKKRSSASREPARAPTRVSVPPNGGEKPTAETLLAEVHTGPARAEGAIASAVVLDLQQAAVEPAVGAARRRKHIAQDVRRQLLARDGFQCAFVGDGGDRCDARAFLQLHHRHPWARGGADDAENLELLCHAHNRLLAEQEFGKLHVDELIAKGRVVRPRRRI
jgi:HNH endonuclease